MTEAEFDAHFMAMALREAQKAADDGEVPTGCVIVAPSVLEPAHDGHPAGYDWTATTARILGRAHNQTEMLTDATAHAEMLAMSQAFTAKGYARLLGTRLYVTKEPCPMCAGAIVLARPETVIWGLTDPKRGGETVFGLFRHPGMNHHPIYRAGLMEAESKSLFQSFFQSRRQN